MWNAGAIQPYLRTTIPEGANALFDGAEKQQMEPAANRSRSAVCQVLAQDGTRGTGCLIVNTHVPGDLGLRQEIKGTALLLTNHDILPDREAARGGIGRFFDLEPIQSENALRQINISLDPDSFFFTRSEGHLDFTVVALKSDPHFFTPSHFVFSIFDAVCPRPGTPNCVIQEPGTTSPDVDLKCSYGTITEISDYSVVDTATRHPGSCGGALIDSQGRLIALVRKEAPNTPLGGILIQKIAKALAKAGANAQTLAFPPPLLEVIDKKCALYLDQKRLGQGHPTTADRFHNLGVTLYRLGSYQSALNNLQSALQIRERSCSNDHPIIAESYHWIGRTLNELGKPDQALKSHQMALKFRKNSFGDNDLRTAESHHCLGLTLMKLSAYREALENYKIALEIRSNLLDPYHPELANSYYGIGLSLDRLRSYEDSLENHKRALEICKKNFGEQGLTTAESYYCIGRTLYKLGKPEEALENHNIALQIRMEELDQNHPSLADSYYGIGRTLSALGRYEEALQSHQMALKIRQETFGDDWHPQTVASYRETGITLAHLGHLEKAADHLQSALDIHYRGFEEGYLGTATIHETLGTILDSLGRNNEAVANHQRALKIRNTLAEGESEPT